MASVNLKQLSQQLNLSISTVSKALRDSYEISEKTKERVLEMSRRMGYVPNPFASALRTNKTRTIALIVPELDNNFFVQAISGAESIASEKNYHILIYNTMEDAGKEQGIIKLLQNGRVDGVLMSMSSTTTAFNHIQNLVNSGTPVIFFDRILPEIKTVKITTDDYTSAFKATELLIRRGCKKIAFLSLPDNLSISNKRQLGYFKALAENKIKKDKSLLIQCSGKDRDMNYKIIRRLLSGTDRPDGIFSAVEKLALVTYHVCHEFKINIPEKIKIICFSNLRTAALLNPPLTTITQPAFEIGRQSAEQLFKYLRKRSWKIPDVNIVLDSEIVIRGST